MPWECLTGYFWNGQSSAESGAKMSPLWSQDSSSVYDPSPEWCAHVRGWWYSLHTSLGAEGKLQRRKYGEWAVADGLFSPRLLEKAQQHMHVYRLFLLEESKFPRPLRSPKGYRKSPHSLPRLSFFFFPILPSGLVQSSATGAKENFQREPFSRRCLEMSGAFLAFSESLRLILFS